MIPAVFFWKHANVSVSIVVDLNELYDLVWTQSGFLK